MGLGLIVFGMELMSIATVPLRQWQPFVDLMQNMRNPLLCVAVGSVFTAIVQSSSATGIVIVLASQALISLETGIGLILGANIGTCVTAFVSAIGRPREALQAAWVHIVFNVAGVVLWVLFIPQLADLVRAVSPVSEMADVLVRAAADTPRQIANAHTLFNVSNLLVLIWFTGPLSRLVDRIVPPRAEAPGIQPVYLDDYFLEQPALALDQIRRELVRLGGLAGAMLQHSLQLATRGTGNDANAMERADDEVDTLYSATIRYLGMLSQRDLIKPQPQQMNQFVGIANYLENIGDVIATDLSSAASRRRSVDLVISASTIEKLQPLHDHVCRSFERALAAVETGNREDALHAIETKGEINDLAEEATHHIAKPLVADEPNRMEAFQIETDIIECYRRINTYTRRIARLSLEAGASE